MAGFIAYPSPEKEVEMSQYPSIRKLLAIILTITTLGMVMVAVVKFGGQKPQQPNGPVAKRPADEGGSSPLPKEKDQPGITQGTFEQALASINEADLKKDLYYLAGQELEGRMSGKAGNKTAAEYVKGRYESYGLPTMYHKFTMGRFNPGPKNETGDDYSQNIYAWQDGNDPTLKNEIVVVGAHMDHIGYGPKASQTPNRREIHPGADDNGSGTVALMEIARACAMMKGKNKRTLVFMSFSSEEMGLIGSQFYCNNPVFPQGSPSISKHVAMINMDMIGYLRKGTFAAGFNENNSSPDLDRMIGDLNTRYAFAKSISGRGGGGSDHAPFYNKRVPVVCLHTGMHPQYHTPDDTPDRINYKGMEQVARYAFELSWRCATEQGRPMFNHGGFKEMTYDHDHGNGVAFPKD